MQYPYHGGGGGVGGVTVANCLQKVFFCTFIPLPNYRINAQPDFIQGANGYQADHRLPACGHSCLDTPACCCQVLQHLGQAVGGLATHVIFSAFDTSEEMERQQETLHFTYCCK